MYEDENYVVCDYCVTTVLISNGEFCYNAELDISYFECNECLREEGSI